MHSGLRLAGRYRLLQPVGRGGMGSIWLARDEKLNCEVAVKLLNAEHLGSDEVVARFEREARSAAAIRSAHVIQILDYGVEGKTPYIAMEWLRGESLAERLQRLQRIPPEQVAQIMGEVACALTIAHERGIIHRDIKPDNVFLVREGEEETCKVVDFGIAHSFDGELGLDAWKTKTGAILGTPCYMSPEQATGEKVDHLTDIWSFGIVAFECLTGKSPFRHDSLPMLFHAICVAPMPVPSQCAPVPKGFDEWFARAAARNRSGRFQSIRQAAHELSDICNCTRPPRRGYSRGRALVTRTAVVLSIVPATVAAAVAYFGSKADHASALGPIATTTPVLTEPRFARVIVTRANANSSAVAVPVSSAAPRAAGPNVAVKSPGQTHGVNQSAATAKPSSFAATHRPRTTRSIRDDNAAGI